MPRQYIPASCLRCSTLVSNCSSAISLRADRRKLLRMLDRLAPGDAVTVTRIDRLARSTFDLFAIVKRIVDAKMKIKSPAELQRFRKPRIPPLLRLLKRRTLPQNWREAANGSFRVLGRRKMRKNLRLQAIYLIMLAALLATAPASASEEPRRGGTLTYMIPADAPPSLDG